MPWSAAKPVARVRVDFNELDEDGHFYALPDRSDRALHGGDRVELWDREGNSAHGKVIWVTDRGRAIIDMVADTWRPGPDLPGLVERAAYGYGCWQIALAGRESSGLFFIPGDIWPRPNLFLRCSYSHGSGVQEVEDVASGIWVAAAASGQADDSVLASAHENQAS